MTTVDSFKSSIVSFNNQWLLVETTTTKQKLATPTKGISLNNATTNLEISSSINCINQDKMEIYHNVVLNGWLVQTVSVFKPQNPIAATQTQTATSSTSQQQLNNPKQTKISSNNRQSSLAESPKSTEFGSGEEEIEEEDAEDDEIIDENNQYDPEADDDYQEEEAHNVEEESSPQQQITSSDQLLYSFIKKIPINVNENKPESRIDNANNKTKSPKKFNSEVSAFSTRSTTNNSESNYSISKANKSLINQMVPAFSCDNIIEDQDKKKRVKKTSILTDDSQNETTRQSFEAEESLMNSNCGSSTKNSGDMLIEDQISCSAIPDKDAKVPLNNVKNNYFITIPGNSSPIKAIGEDDTNKHQIIQLNNNPLNGQASPLRNASQSLETAIMMQLNNGHDSNNEMLQNSSCSQNEDSSNFSIETDKIYNQLINRKRNIVKKAIAKSSNNIDKSLCNISSSNLQSTSNNNSAKPRKSSYLNSIKLASSPSLTNLNYKRDRKNLVKNFIKAFRGFINNPSDEPEVLVVLKEAISESSQIMSELNSIRKNFEKFISKKNYNNTLMVELIQNQEFNVLFSYFLKEKAQEWIYSSKIKDKLSHEEALNHYLLSLKDSKALAKVRCLKYRSATNIEDSQISPMNSKQGSGEQFAGFN
ncbi:hypothetical protein TTHERM_00691680 (macronuclear) [Tetrahymena thermophila SB210]|uniref:Uncharacterized protein n=1 Tax=Tetrahymena thermophila (strain SB210) TaxID=312017 RepID=I7MCP2_TETTS|nr:hypothetical protein TTHERM_00691680 [Tetrahymena thermophila SB210]EAR84470.1 hypothetical protein TTHERM_00691680 [Tetrahymena thermophila SB210]|eukprot:XP_001032133.1 hypothetical protein TTHERM_00691680 [Tetrahymena thermophila SB210]